MIYLTPFLHPTNPAVRSLILVLATFYLGFPTAAFANCDDALKKYPEVHLGLKAWSKSSNITLSEQAEHNIQQEFCLAADRIIQERVANRQLVREKAHSAIEEHLDRWIDSDRKGRSLSSIIRTKLGAPGYSRPKIKKFGVLRINYIRRVDRVKVGRKSYSKPSALLLPVGPISLTGMLKNKVVCRISTTVVVVAKKISC